MLFVSNFEKKEGTDAIYYNFKEIVINVSVPEN